MSSSQRASLSLTAAFVLRKNARQEELKETVTNAGVENQTMKLDGHTIGDWNSVRGSQPNPTGKSGKMAVPPCKYRKLRAPPMPLAT